MAGTKSDQDTTIHLRRTFAAPREKVFRAWTAKEALMSWWAPEGFGTASVETDLRAGGTYDYRMRKLPDGPEFHILGTFREFKPPEKLVYTWTWTAAPGMGETLVTVEFRDLGRSTEVILTHALIRDEDLRKNHAAGWGGCFDRVAEYLSSK
jgi:uncharacterized protein YndB with AHSA1/START domain